MGEHDVNRIFDILDAIREQLNTLIGRYNEKEKRCEEHQEAMKSVQIRLTIAEARLASMESSKETSADWLTKLLAAVGLCISIYAALK